MWKFILILKFLKSSKCTRYPSTINVEDIPIKPKISKVKLWNELNIPSISFFLYTKEANSFLYASKSKSFILEEPLSIAALATALEISTISLLSKGLGMM